MWEGLVPSGTLSSLHPLHPRRRTDVLIRRRKSSLAGYITRASLCIRATNAPVQAHIRRLWYFARRLRRRTSKGPWSNRQLFLYRIGDRTLAQLLVVRVILLGEC